jgi:hypothetical protein
MIFAKSLLQILRDIHASNKETSDGIRAQTEAYKANNARNRPTPEIESPFQLPVAITGYYDFGNASSGKAARPSCESFNGYIRKALTHRQLG